MSPAMATGGPSTQVMPAGADGSATQLKVIDADLHGHEDVAALADYTVNPWSVTLKEIASFPDRHTDLPGISPKADYGLPFPGGMNRSKITTDPKAMLTELDELDLGLASGVLFPDYLLLLPVIEKPEFAVAVASAYNEWLLERWLQESDRLLGAIVVTPQEPAKAAEEIRRHAGERRFVSVCITTCGLRYLMGHSMYDPIYEAAQEADLPIVLHSITAVYPTFPATLDVFETHFMRHAFSHPLSLLSNLASMIETGVPEKFPNLRVGALEAGISWILFAMKRLDREYLERRNQLPRSRELPSTYLRRMWFGTQPLDITTAHGFRDFLAACGGDLKLMYASDWPHHDFDHPDAIKHLRLSEEEQRRILHDNAAELFRMP